MPVTTRSKSNPQPQPEPKPELPKRIPKVKPTKQPKIFNIVAEETTRPARKTYPTRKVIVDGPNNTWSIDLAVMTDEKKENNGMTFMLNCVDCFSRYAWSIPIPNKKATTVLDGLKEIITDNKDIHPKKLWVDQGSEFYNKIIEEWAKNNNIIIYSTFGKSKSAIVERFNRTIKTMIWKYFISHNTRNWVDILPEIMETYNMRQHRAINMSPHEAHFLNDAKIKDLYEHQYNEDEIENKNPPKFHVGDYVRISRVKGIFEKGYMPSWSLEIYKITKGMNTIPWTYSIQDAMGEDIIGSFYEPELMKTEQTPDSDFLVEKVLKTRTYQGKKQEFVKWLGHDEKFNKWIDV